MPYKRAKRVASEVYEVVARTCYHELSDPRLRGIQLTDAEMSDDLQIVKIYYYIKGPEDVRKRVLQGLESAKGYFRCEISRQLGLRVTPEIRYYFDGSIEEAERLDGILDRLRKDGKMGSDV